MVSHKQWFDNNCCQPYCCLDVVQHLNVAAVRHHTAACDPAGWQHHREMPHLNGSTCALGIVQGGDQLFIIEDVALGLTQQLEDFVLHQHEGDANQSTAGERVAKRQWLVKRAKGRCSESGGLRKDFLSCHCCRSFGLLAVASWSVQLCV